MIISDGIPAVPRNRKPRNSVPNPSAEEKKLGIPFRRSKHSEFLSEPFRGREKNVLLIKLTKEMRRRVWRWRGRIWGGRVWRRVWRNYIHRFSLTWETYRFTVPPAVALMNQMRSGIQFIELNLRYMFVIMVEGKLNILFYSIQIKYSRNTNTSTRGTLYFSGCSVAHIGYSVAH